MAIKKCNASKFKQYIAASGLTKRQVSELLGTTPKTIYNIKEGHTVPTIEHAFLIDELTDGTVALQNWIDRDLVKEQLKIIRRHKRCYC